MSASGPLLRNICTERPHFSFSFLLFWVVFPRLTYGTLTKGFFFMIVDGFLRARVLPRFGAGHVEEDEERTFFMLFPIARRAGKEDRRADVRVSTLE